MDTPRNRRRIAVNRLFTPEGVVRPAAIELDGERVVAYRRLNRELPFTEWVGGDMRISGDRITRSV